MSNGSPPETLATLLGAEAALLRARIKVRHIRFSKAFGAATIPRDIGSFAARGEFICYIDSDDWFEPEFFHVFDRLVHTDTIYYTKKILRDGGRNMGREFPFNKPLDGRGDFPSGFFEALSEHGNFLNNSGVVVPRNLFCASGGLLHSFTYCEDYYLWMKLAKLGAKAREHNGIVSILLHPGNNELNVGAPEWLQKARQAAASATSSYENHRLRSLPGTPASGGVSTSS